MGNRIREIRKAKGIPGTTIAESLGITPQYYYEIERGKKRLSADMASKLADILKTNTDYLLGRTDDPEGSVVHRQEDNLTPKEERDIVKELERIMADLKNNEALAFHGEPIDEEEMELLRASLENSLRIAKMVAKKKFTPKKYRK
ncbi:helix-turn-helix domain-containing protein [Brevibacillus sp. SAFN-007a]|uniref:helix-turn-helix domain-containing protein n=1 Tax=Brevibacillus sp. SAFN-007a TaxID=3436862 RepID=UPI003F7EFC81